ncbi:MAG: double zinc ribbon domain-containing protein [Treponema sp.]|jgi:predicted amidophosphoribosyltransferase|nr:double zinc ribbon domain-containing protein [Treponema sp.]
MKILKKIFFLGKNFLFPSDCVLCEGSLIEPDEIRRGLCENCRVSIIPDKGGKCNICGKPLISEIENCLPCRNSETRSFDRLWVLFPYIGRYRKLLTSYKFKKNLAPAEFFTEKILEIIRGEGLIPKNSLREGASGAIKEVLNPSPIPLKNNIPRCSAAGLLIEQEPLLKDAVIVPVPPRPGKIKEAGWDQVEHLVKVIEKNGVPVCRCLKRGKSNVQKRLNREERMENLKGRIFMNGNAPEIALLIDDVITTGSTIEICASVLKESGSQKVYGLCLFYD